MLKYSNEENILQLLSLLKAHGIRKVIASPGTTNETLVGSMQNDSYFEIYSCVDERSAAYMACGLAQESGEPVVLSCTGATAARNYPSGLTEAYYRKLPVLAVTSSQPFGREGQLMPQYTDRNSQFNDIVTLSVQVPIPHNADERWANNIKMNRALLQVKSGIGPAHINLATQYSHDFSVTVLPPARAIDRYTLHDKMPEITAKSVTVFVGSHSRFSDELQNAVDEFCEKYNGVVLCDQTSNYKGKYRFLGGLMAGQLYYYAPCRYTELTVHIGEVSGSYYDCKKTEVWRVNRDGEVRDPFRLLRKVFFMEEIDFFRYYNHRKKSAGENKIYGIWKKEQDLLYSMLPDLPLSNVWMCKKTAPRLPDNSVLYLGILNSLRSWNLFDVPKSVYTYCNVGGFGIDGGLSSMVGASLACPDKLYFGIFGDLGFFYDMNVLGNRHVGNNLRIIVENNGTGYEMHVPKSPGRQFGSAEIDKYFAAAGHFGHQSRELLMHYATDLGFEYRKAETKGEYLSNLDYFVSPEVYEKPVLFEVFVDPADDDRAYIATRELRQDSSGRVKKMAKSILGESVYAGLKRSLKRR